MREIEVKYEQLIKAMNFANRKFKISPKIRRAEAAVETISGNQIRLIIIR